MNMQQFKYSQPLIFFDVQTVFDVLEEIVILKYLELDQSQHILKRDSK